MGRGPVSSLAGLLSGEPTAVLLQLPMLLADRPLTAIDDPGAKGCVPVGGMARGRADRMPLHVSSFDQWISQTSL